MGGLRFNTKSGKKEEISFDRNPPFHSARFQTNKKFYQCGGKLVMDGEQELTSQFFSIDSEGKSAMLESMKNERECVSLSGLPSQLIAVGGWNQDDLNICEKYFVSRNKWVRFPPLNTARKWPGSIVLQCERAFCFCGTG